MPAAAVMVAASAPARAVARGSPNRPRFRVGEVGSALLGQEVPPPLRHQRPDRLADQLTGRGPEDPPARPFALNQTIAVY